MVELSGAHSMFGEDFAGLVDWCCVESVDEDHRQTSMVAPFDGEDSGSTEKTLTDICPGAGKIWSRSDATRGPFCFK